MQWASTVSTEPLLERAVAQATAALRSQLSASQADLMVAFASHHHAAQFDRLPEFVKAEAAVGVLVGASAGGVIGGGREIEQHPGLSLTAAVLPNVELTGFHVEAHGVPEDEAPAAWQALTGVSAARAPHFVLLPDPFSFDAEAFIKGLDRTYPDSRKIGGLASGGQQPGTNALFLDGTVYRSGLVGVALAGDVQVDTIVAQGCRPVGQPMFATKCQRNILCELDGEPAVKALHDLYEQLDASDQALAQHSLFVGIVMKRDRQEYGQGDFLIRNVIGIEPQRGALAVGALLEENSVIQFHLRDSKTSAEDLDQLLGRYRDDAAYAPPHGALLFSCLGRGIHLYGRPDHDTDAVRRYLGDLPLGGFFCNGEIGPVHDTTFLHGYTSAFGLFRSRKG